MNADPKAIYWTAAFVNMAVIVGCAFLGVRNVRRGNVAIHRRLMLTGGVLVIAFLVSYLFKTSLLGREQLELWAPAYVLTLRIHETCVTAMLLAGAFAWAMALRLKLAAPTRDPHEDPIRFRSRVRWHRRAGWTAIVSGVLGLATAAIVLYGMYARL